MTRTKVQAMKLPNHWIFKTLFHQSTHEVYQNNLGCCRAETSARILGTDEDPLCRFRETELEAYTFSWESSYDGDAVIHVSRKDNSFQLKARCSSFSRLRLKAPFVSGPLSPTDWNRLQDALSASNFWGLDTTDYKVGLDGAQWLIEGRRGDIYHAVERWSPRGALRDLGKMFFTLAGPPLVEIEPY